MITRRIVSVVALGLLLAACGGGEPEPQAPPKAEPSVPAGRPLDAGQIKALAALFPDNPLTGGQVAPRSYRWVNEQVAIFVQFDKPNPDEATALRYIGVSVKGVYCKEAQPDAEQGSFTHFHRLKAVDYGDGHAGRPGEPGYWLSWVAVDAFDQRDRAVKPGVDYAFSPTEPPACGGNVPKADFAAPGARLLSKPDIQTLASAFGDNPLTGGQVAPRLYRWVNEDAQIFLQFDERNPAEATALKYVGVSVRGEYCRSKQPHPDFTHFHRVNAPDYQQGHAGPPDSKGYWLLWVAAAEFEQQGRTVTPGVDREFSPTVPPDC